MNFVRTIWSSTPRFEPIHEVGAGFSASVAGSNARASRDVDSQEFTFLTLLQGDEWHHHVAFQFSPRWIFQAFAMPAKAQASTSTVVETHATPTKDATIGRFQTNRLTRLQEILTVLASPDSFPHLAAVSTRLAVQPLILTVNTPTSQGRLPFATCANHTRVATMSAPHAWSEVNLTVNSSGAYSRTEPFDDYTSSWQSTFQKSRSFTTTSNRYELSAPPFAGIALKARESEDRGVLSNDGATRTPNFASFVWTTHNSAASRDTSAAQPILQTEFVAWAGDSSPTRPRGVDSAATLSLRAFDGRSHDSSTRTFGVTMPFASVAQTCVESFPALPWTIATARVESAEPRPTARDVSPPTSGNFVRLERPLTVETMEMVVRTPAPSASSETKSTVQLEGIPATKSPPVAPAPAGLPADLLQRLIDQVVRSLDARALAARERFGRF